MNQNNNIQKINTNTNTGNKTIEERRWELLKGVRSSLEDLNKKEGESESIIRFILN